YDRPVALATDVLAELVVMPRSQIFGGGVFDGIQSKQYPSKLVGGFPSKSLRVVAERRADNLA
ncbi:hypothetical protein, partial [Klebsiella pneumoniae]|uniref:hypothetical protein n=1 Tax=Klebsiella pneumoniae TaxID=573 RepID=UPI001D0D9CF2